MTAANQRRPLSAPRAALPVILYFYLLIGLVPAIATIELGMAFGAGSNALLGHFFIYLGVVGTIALAVLIAVRNGAVWGLTLLGLVSRMLVALIVATLAASALLASSAVRQGVVGARSTGEYGLIVIAICVPLAWLLLRGLRRVRWLDPKSTSDEWELPARG